MTYFSDLKLSLSLGYLSNRETFEALISFEELFGIQCSHSPKSPAALLPLVMARIPENWFQSVTFGIHTQIFGILVADRLRDYTIKGLLDCSKSVIFGTLTRIFRIWVMIQTLPSFSPLSFRCRRRAVTFVAGMPVHHTARTENGYSMAILGAP